MDKVCLNGKTQCSPTDIGMHTLEYTYVLEVDHTLIARARRGKAHMIKGL